jgi:uncharacterized membrane protein
MNNKDKKKEELEQPIIFWSSIGVAISTSCATAMKMGTWEVVLCTLAGLVIGFTVGYWTKKEQEKENKLNHNIQNDRKT